MKKRKARAAERRVTELEYNVACLAWWHAELLHQLATVITIQTNAIQTVAWLFAEKDFYMQQFIASEERLVRRAKAVKEAQARAAAAPPVVTPGINPAAMQRNSR